MKTGAGEGIRTFDPNLGKIRLYEIFILNQLFIKLVKNPNTIRTFFTPIDSYPFIHAQKHCVCTQLKIGKYAATQKFCKRLHSFINCANIFPIDQNLGEDITCKSLANRDCRS
jgi:hypothetical protein